ncbi:hypothetical protein ACN1C3_19240 [Pseudomonas sp. H11T01]
MSDHSGDACTAADAGKVAVRQFVR